MTLLDEHPLPWEVAYSQKSSIWDEKSSPYIVDANGKIVVEHFFNTSTTQECMTNSRI